MASKDRHIRIQNVPNEIHEQIKHAAYKCDKPLHSYMINKIEAMLAQCPDHLKRECSPCKPAKGVEIDIHTAPANLKRDLTNVCANMGVSVKDFVLANIVKKENRP